MPKQENLPPEPTPEDSFAADIEAGYPQTPQIVQEADLPSRPGNDVKAVVDALPDWTMAELHRLAIIQPGTPLEQGAVYLRLTGSDRHPFKAIGGDAAGEDDHIIAKKLTDYVLWDRLTNGRGPEEIDRPT